MKKCKKCNKNKNLNEFYERKTAKDRYDYICKKCSRENAKNWRKENKQKVKEYQQLWIKKNPTYHGEYNKNYINPWEVAHGKEYKRNYEREKRKDKSYRILTNLRSRLTHFVKISREQSYSKDIGCTKEELKKYLESLFQPGMSWENYGHNGWHIDHKYPLSVAYKEGEESFKKACHYTNLQPLWAVDNLRKGDKI